MGIFKKPVTSAEINSFRRGKVASARVAEATAAKARRQDELKRAKAAAKRKS